MEVFVLLLEKSLQFVYILDLNCSNLRPGHKLPGAINANEDGILVVLNDVHFCHLKSHFKKATATTFIFILVIIGLAIIVVPH